MSCYEILGIAPQSGFAALKKAYYKRVKECHPDLFGGSKAKEEEFKRLVAAFDILSDPDKRRKYDASAGIYAAEEGPPVQFAADIRTVMDTDADDTLEELIVGNNPPENATLASLFLDLEKTEVFITFREGKNLFSEKRYAAAIPFFRKVVSHSPNNILYRYYAGASFAAVGNYGDAKFHFQAAINIGSRRMPPQRLERIRMELDGIRKKQYPWWMKIKAFLSEEKGLRTFYRAEDEMVEETNRAIANLIRERKLEEKEKERKKLGA